MITFFKRQFHDSGMTEKESSILFRIGPKSPLFLNSSPNSLPWWDMT